MRCLVGKSRSQRWQRVNGQMGQQYWMGRVGQDPGDPRQIFELFALQCLLRLLDSNGGSCVRIYVFRSTLSISMDMA